MQWRMIKEQLVHFKNSKTFDTIAFAKVSTSARSQRSRTVKEDDTIILNRDHLIQTAKGKALELLDSYSPPAYNRGLKLPGTGARIAMTIALKGFRLQGKISDHDVWLVKLHMY